MKWEIGWSLSMSNPSISNIIVIETIFARIFSHLVFGLSSFNGIRNMKIKKLDCKE
jgi:hypothetical protein